MQAIILKKIPVTEYDELVVCYTLDFGKATYMAKSVLRPTSKQASHLDILTLVEFELVSKLSLARRSFSGGRIITNAYSLNNFGHLKTSLQALAVANYLLEVFDKFVFENDPDLKLWQFLNSKLLELDNIATCDVAILRPKEWENVLKITQQEISQVLGYNKTIDMEDIIQSRFASLVFAREILVRFET